MRKVRENIRKFAGRLQRLGRTSRASQRSPPDAAHGIEQARRSDTFAPIGAANAPRAEQLVALEQRATSLYENGDFSECVALRRQVLDGRIQLSGPGDPRTIEARFNLAAALSRRGAHEEAIPLFHEVIEVQARRVGRESPYVLDVTEWLATALLGAGRPLDARPLFEHVARRYRAASPLYEVRALQVEHSAALCIEEAGDVEGAREARQSLVNRFSEQPSLHSHFSNTPTDLLWKLELPLLREFLETRQETMGPEHPDVLTILAVLADRLHSQGDSSEALLLQRRVHHGLVETVGVDHPHTLEMLRRVGTIQASVDPEEAIRTAERTAEAHEWLLGPSHPSTLESRLDVIDRLYKQGNYREAERLARLLRDAAIGLQGPSHSTALSATRSLGKALIYDAPEEAASLLGQLADELTLMNGPEDADTLATRYDWGLALCQAGDRERGLGEMREATMLLTMVLGSEHPWATKATVELARMEGF